MYCDSELGLCIDITGPDGNLFNVLGYARNLARQLDKEEGWKEAIKAVRHMDGNYMTMLNMFKEFFPMVTLVGYEEVKNAHEN